MKARSYNQICGVAQALDVLGDRWTLLVVRELLLGPRRYRDLAESLPGIGTNILADRLKALVAAGVARRGKLPPPAGVAVYELTERGEALRPALRSLALWGLELIPADPSTGAARASWAAMSMGAVMDEAGPSAGPGSVAFAVGDERFHMATADGETVVRVGVPPVPADLSLETDLATFLAVGSGRRSAREAIDDGALAVLAGDREAAERLFDVFRLPLAA